VGSETEEDAVCHLTGRAGKAAFSQTCSTAGESLQHFAKKETLEGQNPLG